VGTVLDVWPPREVIAGEIQRMLLADLKRVILKRWHGVLSVEEETYIRSTWNRAMLDSRFAILQRVRFALKESFAGPLLRDIYTDASSCGYRFESGRVYLVNATRDGSRYRTGPCFRTNRIESYEALEDLKALRAWKSGKPLAPRIYGRIRPSDLRVDTRLRLIGTGPTRPVAVDEGGLFSIDDLESQPYRLEVMDARGSAERLIDLSRLRCFEVTAVFSDAWSILGFPIVTQESTILNDK
jgi:hypothetical protein